MTLQITLNDSFILLEYTDEIYNIYRTTVDNNDMFVVNFMNKDIVMLYDLLNNNDNYKIEKNTNNILLTYCKPIIIKYELKFINNNQNNNIITNLKNENIELKNKIKEITNKNKELNKELNNIKIKQNTNIITNLKNENIELKNKIKEITNTNKELNKELNNIKIKQNTKIINGNLSGFLCDYVLLDNKIISKNIEKIEIDFVFNSDSFIKTNIKFISIDNTIFNIDHTNGISIRKNIEINNLINKLTNYIKLFSKIENLVIHKWGTNYFNFNDALINFLSQIKEYENKISYFIFGGSNYKKQLIFNNIDEIMDYDNRVGPFF